jgi:hypothetical protein
MPLPGRKLSPQGRRLRLRHDKLDECRGVDIGDGRLRAQLRSSRSRASASVPAIDIGFRTGLISSKPPVPRRARPLAIKRSMTSASSAHGASTARGRPCSVTTKRSPARTRRRYRLRSWRSSRMPTRSDIFSNVAHL